MSEQRSIDIKKVDTKEFQLPETSYIRNIENRVFQGIVLQCLSQIDGIALVEGNLIDSLLGRGTLESSVKGIFVEQDTKNHSVGIKIEINICYGFSIPEKAEEVQSKIAVDITRWTGLHVSYVHLTFRNLISSDQVKSISQVLEHSKEQGLRREASIEDEYSEEF